MNKVVPPMQYPRRILLAVTGMSPQIVTETLYALGLQSDPGADPEAPAPEPFLPTEVHLLTTEIGAALARTALLHPDGGQFHALLADYPQLGRPVFDESHIHIICDEHGKPLPDIRTPAENANAADTITALMAELTRDPQAALHVSIAGGRKTMGFYLGYAFSLFARPQDALSHILVSSAFEGHPEFFFPPAQPKRLTTRSGQHLDTADATVTLARIPVVRLRHGQPEALLAGHASFNDTVNAIQRSLAPPSLFISLPDRRVLCGGQSVQLPPALLAWLAWWAQQHKGGQGAHNWRTAGAKDYLRIYQLTVGQCAEAFERANKRLQDGMDKEFFEQNNAKLTRELKQQLGELAATPYLLRTSGKRPLTTRSLSLPPEAIQLRLG